MEQSGSSDGPPLRLHDHRRLLRVPVLRDAEAEVRQASHSLDADRLQVHPPEPGATEESDAVTQEDWRKIDEHIVDETGVNALLGRVRAEYENVLPPGGGERPVDGVGDVPAQEGDRR